MEEAGESTRATAAAEVSPERERASRGEAGLRADRFHRLQAEIARLAFLDALSVHLAEAPGEAERLEGVVRLAVPALGDWAGIFVAGEAGGLELAAWAGDAALGDAVEAHAGGEPPLVARAWLGVDPTSVHALPGAAGGARPALLLAALRAKGRTLGALAVARDAAEGPGPADRALAAEVARRVALALEQARVLRDATAAASAREEFLHVASHELRGPVGTLALTLELLARDVEAGLRDRAAARLRAVGRQAQRLVRLSDTLLDVSRITAGRLELAVERADLAALARDVVARSAREAVEAGLEVSVDAPAPVPCLFDPARLDQVVTNLLSNALKYGGGSPVRIRVSSADGRARLEVVDRGIGIAPADQERIFGRFERAVSGRHYGGLGLGLWIVRRIVEAHAGVIAVRSAPGLGSTFVVELPA